MQNWSTNVFNLVTKRAVAYDRRDRRVGRLQPRLEADDEVPERLPARRARARRGPLDRVRRRAVSTRTPAARSSTRRRTRPRTSSPSRSPRTAGAAPTAACSRSPRARTARSSKVVCDALLLDEHSRSDTYPTIRIGEDDVNVAHEATVSKVGEDQLFYLMTPRHPRGGGLEADRQRLHRADHQGAADGVRGRDEPPDRAADGGFDWLARRADRGVPGRTARAPPAERHAGAADVQGAPGLGVHRHLGAGPRGLRARAGRHTARRRRRPEPLFDAARRRPRALPDGVIVTTIEQAAREHPELIERHLGSVVPVDDVFVALQRRRLPRRRVRLRPARRRRRAADLARSRCSPERHRAQPAHADRARGGRSGGGLGAVPVGLRGARRRLQRRHRAGRRRRRAACATCAARTLSEQSWIFGAQRAEVGRDASLDWVALGFGSARGRVRMETRLGGEGAERARDRRLREPWPPAHRLRHDPGARGAEHDLATSPSAACSRTARRAVWKGNIIVDPGAQKTDAFQESRNLLLSKRAHADAIPGLEIQANDVRCTHAAAIAQVDPEQLFYLRSRGLPEADRQAARDRGLPRGARRALRGGAGARGARRPRSSAGSRSCSAKSPRRALSESTQRLRLCTGYRLRKP